VIVFIVVPKNSGLKEYRKIAIASINAENNEKLEVRGEDVPFWVEELIKKRKKTIGITGQDLYKEYCLKNYRTNTRTIRLIEWNDENALFRKPTLCLLGPENKNLDIIPKKQRICISDKYKFLAKKYLNLLEERGFVFEKFYVSGSTESSYSVGLADLVIDIVYSGKSMKELGLCVYDKIFYSNIVLIGAKKNNYFFGTQLESGGKNGKC
jgi:ATP phosphoribosyltransferase